MRVGVYTMLLLSSFAAAAMSVAPLLAPLLLSRLRHRCCFFFRVVARHDRAMPARWRMREARAAQDMLDEQRAMPMLTLIRTAPRRRCLRATLLLHAAMPRLHAATLMPRDAICRAADAMDTPCQLLRHTRC